MLRIMLLSLAFCNKLDDALVDAQRRVTGLSCSFSCGPSASRHSAFYFQKALAELLMVFATGAEFPWEAVRDILGMANCGTITILVVTVHRLVPDRMRCDARNGIVCVTS